MLTQFGLFPLPLVLVILLLVFPTTTSAAKPDALNVTIDMQHKEDSSPMMLFAKALAEQLNVPLKPYICPWARCLKAIEEGQADIIISVFYSKERDAYMNFISPPIATYAIDFVFLHLPEKTFNINRYEDLQQYSIAVVRGGKYFERFDRDSSLTKVLAPDYGSARQLVLNARVDLVIDLSLVNSKLEFLDTPEGKLQSHKFVYREQQPEYIAVSQHSKWRYQTKAIETALKNLHKSGAVAKFNASNILD